MSLKGFLWRIALRMSDARVRSRIAVRPVLDPLASILAVLAAICLWGQHAWIPSPRGWHAIDRLTLYIVIGMAARGAVEAAVTSNLGAALKGRWLGAILTVAALVGLALATAGLGPEALRRAVYAASSQGLLAYLVLSRSFRLVRLLLDYLRLSPVHIILASFALVIAIGTGLLISPKATPADRRIGALDALFTATSATCVTGLVVRDTGADFTLFGQGVILGLIQVGGLGIMTFAAFFVTAVGRGLSVRDMVAMRDVISSEDVASLPRIVAFILASALAIEALGAALLYRTLVPAGTPATPDRLFDAAFHSISAFCNAGFALRHDNLVGASPAALLVVAVLVTLGGLGFLVLSDIFDHARRLFLGGEAWRAGLRTHSRAVLWTSGSLVLIGAAGLFLFEAGNPRLPLALEGTAVHAAFLSVSARTAGFNSVDLAGLSGSSIFLLMLLMFVGASPGSTGGGIKTTTFLVLLQRIWALLTNRIEVEMFRRLIPRSVIQESIALVLLAGLLVCGAILVLLHTEAGRPFEEVVFECVSAFGTVGLSLGLTPSLTVAGKGVIILLMYVGRLGPLSLILAVRGKRPAARNFGYPQGRIMVG